MTAYKTSIFERHAIKFLFQYEGRIFVTDLFPMRISTEGALNIGLTVDMAPRY